MQNLTLWLLFVAVSVAVYWRWRFRDLNIEGGARQKSIALLRAELDALLEKVAELTDNIENLTLTPAELEEKHFNRLPALTSDLFVPLSAGDRLFLVLKAFGCFRAIEYIHQELIYRTPGQKDAVAYGKARFDASSELSDVRIFFSRPNATATLRGLADDGHVKEGRLLPGN